MESERAEPPQALNLFAAGLFAPMMLLIPAIQAAQFVNLEFYPGSSATSVVGSVWTWEFLYFALLAWGVLRVRTKPGREDLHRVLVSCVCGQAVVLSFVHVVLFVRRVAGGGPPYGGEPGALFMLVCILVFLVAPILAGVHCRFSRRGGLLLLGQLVPIFWLIFVLATGLGFST